MTLNWIHTGIIAATSVALLSWLTPAFAQSGNPWNPYPDQQTQPTPAPAPTPKTTYYEEAPAPLPSEQSATESPSRFAPANLDQMLSAGPQTQPYAPPYGYSNGYQGAPNTPYANPPAYYGPSPGGYPQGYPMGVPPGYGGYSPPMGNNNWGGMPFNNFSPFGF